MLRHQSRQNPLTNLYLITILATLLPKILAEDETLDKTACAALGLNTDTLRCTSCDEMADFSLSPTLIANCRKCCKSSSENEEITKFAKAELVICNWKLGHFPQIKEFINDYSKNFSNLKINYQRGSMPVLKLFEKDSSSSSDVGINGWEREAIVEYLEEKLEK